MLLNQSVSLDENFVVRAPTFADAEAVTELANICSMVLVGQAEFSVEETHTEWTSPGYNLETDMRVVFTPGGRLVGYMEVDASQPVKPWIWARVHPDYQGQGIGTFLMTWGEERARQSIAKVPEGTRVVMHAGTDKDHQPTHQLFQDLGMYPVRQFWRMQVDLDTAPPQPQWAEGITLRTLPPGEDVRTIYQAVRDSFQDHWGYVERPFEEAFANWKHHLIESNPYFDPSLWFIAMDGDEIAGFAICDGRVIEDEFKGWVNVLGVRRPWRRKGVALALLHHAFGEMYRRGNKRAGLGVDGSSLTGATRLYEKAGMVVNRRFDEYEKELRPGVDPMRRTLDTQE